MSLEYIYFVRDKKTDLVKIGRTKDVKQRYLALKYEMSKPEFIYAFRATDGEAEEKKLHALFDPKRDGVGGERFRLDDTALDAIAALIGDRLIRNIGVPSIAKMPPEVRILNIAGVPYDEFLKNALIMILNECGNISATAKRIGTNRSTLHNIMDRVGIVRTGEKIRGALWH